MALNQHAWADRTTSLQSVGAMALSAMTAQCERFIYLFHHLQTWSVDKHENKFFQNSVSGHAKRTETNWFKPTKSTSTSLLPPWCVTHQHSTFVYTAIVSLCWEGTSLEIQAMNLWNVRQGILHIHPASYQNHIKSSCWSCMHMIVQVTKNPQKEHTLFPLEGDS